MSTPGKGILAGDEWVSLIGEKFAPLGIENTEENRRKYRELLYTTANIEKYISGIIMFEETAKKHATS